MKGYVVTVSAAALVASSLALAAPQAQDAGAEIEHTLVTVQLAVADVQRLVFDEQADELAVRHVDARFAGLRITVDGLG